MSHKFITVPSSIAQAVTAATCWCKGTMLVTCGHAVWDVVWEEAHKWSQLECHGCARLVHGRLGTAAG